MIFSFFFKPNHDLVQFEILRVIKILFNEKKNGRSITQTCKLCAATNSKLIFLNNKLFEYCVTHTYNYGDDVDNKNVNFDTFHLNQITQQWIVNAFRFQNDLFDVRSTIKYVYRISPTFICIRNSVKEKNFI